METTDLNLFNKIKEALDIDEYGYPHIGVYDLIYFQDDRGNEYIDTVISIEGTTDSTRSLPMYIITTKKAEFILPTYSYLKYLESLQRGIPCINAFIDRTVKYVYAPTITAAGTSISCISSDAYEFKVTRIRHYTNRNDDDKNSYIDIFDSHIEYITI